MLQPPFESSAAHSEPQTISETASSHQVQNPHGNQPSPSGNDNIGVTAEKGQTSSPVLQTQQFELDDLYSSLISAPKKSRATKQLLGRLLEVGQENVETTVKRELLSILKCTCAVSDVDVTGVTVSRSSVDTANQLWALLQVRLPTNHQEMVCKLYGL